MSDNLTGVSGAPSECRFRLASVYILSAPFHLDKAFDYIADSSLCVEAGDLVAVPFGGGNRPETALVRSVTALDTNAELKQYKPISHVLSRSLSLNKDAISLVDFLRERTFCTTGEAIRAITPSAAFSKLEEMLTCSSALPEYYSVGTKEHQIYTFISDN